MNVQVGHQFDLLLWKWHHETQWHYFQIYTINYFYKYVNTAEYCFCNNLKCFVLLVGDVSCKS